MLYIHIIHLHILYTVYVYIMIIFGASPEMGVPFSTTKRASILPTIGVPGGACVHTHIRCESKSFSLDFNLHVLSN